MHSLSCLPSLVEIELCIAVFTDSLEHNLVYGLQSNTTLMFCVIVLPLIALFVWNGYSFVRLIFVQKKDAAIEEITMQHEEEKAQILEEAKRLALEELKKEMKEKEKETDKKSE